MQHAPSAMWDNGAQGQWGMLMSYPPECWPYRCHWQQGPHKSGTVPWQRWPTHQHAVPEAGNDSPWPPRRGWCLSSWCAPPEFTHHPTQQHKYGQTDEMAHIM